MMMIIIIIIAFRKITTWVSIHWICVNIPVFNWKYELPKKTIYAPVNIRTHSTSPGLISRKPLTMMDCFERLKHGVSHGLH